MTTSAVVLALAVFGASAVEMVEALTIVVAAGVTRGWRSAIEGSAAAVLVLAALVLAVGVPLARLVPIDVLRVVIGALLLVLGLDWLRKAVLRASGHKALHDEDAIYARTVEDLSAGGRTAGEHLALRADTGTGADAGADAARPAASPWRYGTRDATGFTVAFKGVFLEGMEVVLIVITLGASSGHLALAAVAAAAAAVVVGGVGLVVARQLSEIPENSMKLAVGIMLTSFGVFWVGEGAGVHWPGSDLMILILIGVFATIAAVLTIAMRRIGPSRAPVTVPSDPVR
jgi:Ca2+/H+ antiporter, TMEM165/GDT1 family